MPRSSSAAREETEVARLNDLNEAREQQAATSEILRVIASSPTNIQPVFDAIVRSAVKLCHGVVGAVNTFDGELTHVVAVHNYTPEALAAVQTQCGQVGNSSRGEPFSVERLSTFPMS